MLRRSWLVLGLVLGCSDSTTGAPETSREAAEQLCETLDTCNGSLRPVSRAACIDELEDDLGRLSRACYSCLAGLACGAWSDIARGSDEPCDICSACPCSVDLDPDPIPVVPSPTSCQPGTMRSCPTLLQGCIGASFSRCLPGGSWSSACECSVSQAGTGGFGGPTPRPAGSSAQAGSTAPNPLQCGSIVCPDLPMLPFISGFGLPRGCCVDPATSTCGGRLEGGACMAASPPHPDCPLPTTAAPGVSTCCMQGTCGVDLGGTCMLASPALVPPTACTEKADAGI